MEQKEYWKDFRKLVKNRPEYRQWLHCKDPEEKALRSELLRLLVRFDSRADEAKKLPMPTEMTDVYLTAPLCMSIKTWLSIILWRPSLKTL